MLITLRSLPVFLLAVVLNAVHIPLHHLEGGTLDMILDFLNASCAQLLSGNTR